MSNKAPMILSILLAVGFVFFGVQKFGAVNPIFAKIAANSGMAFFEPYVRMFTGVSELLVAVLLLIPRTRLAGALMGLGLLIGAIGFHLSPWLGVNLPEEGGYFVFTAACIMTVLSVINLKLLKSSGAKLF